MMVKTGWMRWLNLARVEKNIPFDLNGGDGGMTDDERAYYDRCDIYDPSMSYEEYVVNIFRCLMLSDWHYSADEATRRIQAEYKIIQRAFEEKQSVLEAMVDVGYCCG